MIIGIGFYFIFLDSAEKPATVTEKISNLSMSDELDIKENNKIDRKDEREKVMFQDIHQPYLKNIILGEALKHESSSFTNLITLNNKHLIITYSNGYYSNELRKNVVEHIVRLGTVEGGAILLNDNYAHLKEGAEFIKIVKLSFDSFVVVYRTGTAGLNSLSGGGDGRAVFGKITNGEIILGEPVGFGKGIKHYGGFIHATALNEKQFLVVYPRGFDNGLIVMGTIKEDAIYFTEETIFYSDYTTENAFVEKLDTDSFVIMFNDGGSRFITVGTVQGENLLFDEKQQYFTEDRYLKIRATSATGDGRFLIIYEASSGDGGYYSVVGFISDRKVVLGQAIKILERATTKTIMIDQLDANRFVVLYESFKNREYYTTDIFIATLQKDSIIVSEHINIPEAYNSPIVSGIDADSFALGYNVYVNTYRLKEPVGRSVVGKLP